MIVELLVDGVRSRHAVSIDLLVIETKRLIAGSAAFPFVKFAEVDSTRTRLLAPSPSLLLPGLPSH